MFICKLGKFVHRAAVKCQTVSVEQNQVHVRVDSSCECVCVPVCTVHICTFVFACESECKLAVSCRPRCRLMVYRQVIYDLSVAGREKGDTRLSPQINKRCSGAHITSPLHVCERNRFTSRSFLFIFCLLKQLAAGLLILLSSFPFFYSLHFNTFFSSCPSFITVYPPTLSCPFSLPPLVVFVCRLTQQGAGDFDMPAIIYRNMV